jgi:hypothetical protein
MKEEVIFIHARLQTPRGLYVYTRDPYPVSLHAGLRS